MATHIKILSASDIENFDMPPKFSGEERKNFFRIPSWAAKLIQGFRHPSNKVGFIIQLGYFKATKKFFNLSTYHADDIRFVSKQINSPDPIDLPLAYNRKSFWRYKHVILQRFGISNFNGVSKNLIAKEALLLCNKQMRPRQIFLSLVDLLAEQKIEVPSYHALAEIITNALKTFEKSLLTTIDRQLSDQERNILESIFEYGEEYQEGDKQDSKVKRYKLTRLKKSYQSTKPSQIKENIRVFHNIRSMFDTIKPILESIGLSPESIQYYAQVVMKSRGVQMSGRRTSKKYLFLMAFVAFQYYRLNDILIDILLQSVQTMKNASDRSHKDQVYEERKIEKNKQRTFAKNVRNPVALNREVCMVAHNKSLSPEKRIEIIQGLLPIENIQQLKDMERYIDAIEEDAKQISGNLDYYDILENESKKLQLRASDILKNIQFSPTTSNNALYEAIAYYQKTDGNIGQRAPLEVFKSEEQKVLFSDNGKIRVSLYKVLLLLKVAEGIKSGTLNLIYSYKYKSFEDYLISQKEWNANKEEFLERTGLANMTNFPELIQNLKAALHDQFRETNENILDKTNKYALVRKDVFAGIKTPAEEKNTDRNLVSDLFPKTRYISLYEVLASVNEHTSFINCFEPLGQTHNRDSPDDKVFFAGIIGYGCNIGIGKISKISRNIKQSELENVVNWRFSRENILRANDEILTLIDQLELPILFKKDRKITHTSSDGKKYRIAVNSLNAGHSYKYFGQEQGVCLCRFIDEEHRLFYAIVIHPAEREAGYTIDGLMHNDVVKSDIHSTDTHGYSEMIFAVTHLLGISFAPRIKNLKNKTLYSFEKPSVYKKAGYPVLPAKSTNINAIEKLWDDVLRMVATIKLKHATASQLFKRLTSYSRQHPLYWALKQFGQIIKTLFILKYIDDLKLRQMIQKQLNKIESANRFADAVFYAENREFQCGTKEEQQIVAACKLLIENSIICWNYLYVTKLLLESGSEEERKEIIKTLKHGSIVVWQHIHIEGEYDFSEEMLENSVEFNLPDLLSLKLE